MSDGDPEGDRDCPELETGPASPYELWVTAGGESAEGADREKYHRLLRESGYLLIPGDAGYEDASATLPCGWRPGST
jgi:hypothetical protein